MAPRVSQHSSGFEPHLSGLAAADSDGAIERLRQAVCQQPEAVLGVLEYWLGPTADEGNR